MTILATIGFIIAVIFTVILLLAFAVTIYAAIRKD